MKTNIIINRPKPTEQGISLTEINRNVHSEQYNIIKAERAKKLYLLGIPVKIICTELYISRTTLYRYLKDEGLTYESYIRHSSIL